MRSHVIATLLVLESAASAAPASVEKSPPPPKTEGGAAARAAADVKAAMVAKVVADAKAAEAMQEAKEARAAAGELERTAVAERKAADDARTRNVPAAEQTTRDAQATSTEARAKAARATAAALTAAAKTATDEATTANDRLNEAVEAAVAVIVVPGECHGWGLLTPLYGVSNRQPSRIDPNKRDELRITGPVASGIGGGYYRPLFKGTCNHDRMWTAEAFAFSEGLDPSRTFQLGVGAGIGLTVFGKFQFGVAVGYDLIRHEVIDTGGVVRTYNNGLLLANDVFGCGYGGPGEHWGDAEKCAARNATLLFTFTLTTGGTDAAAPKPSPATSE